MSRKLTVEEKNKNKLMNGIWKKAREGNPAKVLKYIEKNNIFIDYLDVDRGTALSKACMMKELGAVKVLASLGSNLDGYPGIYNPLNVAGYYGHNEIVKFLISAGANINAKFGDRDFSILHSFSQYALLEIIILLLEARADPNIKDKHGFTPLMMAACNPRPLQEVDEKVMKLLVKYGAKVNLKDDRGFTALKIAIDKKREILASYLRSIGGTE